MTDRNQLQGLAEPRHHRAEIVFGAVSLLAALVLCGLLPFEVQWLKNKPFTQQPGFSAAISIAGMLAFGVLEFLFAWRRNADGRGESIVAEVRFWIVSLEYAFWFMAYVLILPVLGYLPSTVAFCLLLTWRLGYRSPAVLCAAVLIGIATVLVFKSFLSVKIPGGVLYEYFPASLRNILIVYF